MKIIRFFISLFVVAAIVLGALVTLMICDDEL